MGWFDKKTRELKKINCGDIILIYCPDGYTRTATGQRNHPVEVSVKNNCTITEKLWIQLPVNINNVAQILDFILEYKSNELSNFLLLNVPKEKIEPPVIEKTKEELETELKEAVSSNNFEMAAAINEKIKNA